MMYHAIHDLIKHSFPKPSKKDWSEAASKEILGKNPLEALTWRSEDQIKFFPYYDHQDCENLNYRKRFQLPPSRRLHSGARSWQNVPCIRVHDYDEANEVALNHLQNGADGIIYDLRQVNAVDINRLLADIDWRYCSVSFLVTSPETLGDQVRKFAEKNNYDPGLMEGTLFWENAPENGSGFFDTLSSYSGFNSLGLYIDASSPVQEITEALLKAVQVMDMFTDQGFNKEDVWKRLSLSVCARTDFLVEIAKFKALRLLLYQLANAFGIHDYNYADFKINARTASCATEKFQPHGNLLHGTFAAMAAVTGGCDSLTVTAEDEKNTMLTRVARNVSNILREEAYLDKVSDPVAGAYAIDNMIHEIAQAAWQEFQLKTSAS